MPKEKDTTKDTPENITELNQEEQVQVPEGLENAPPQGQTAGRLAAAISPAVAREIMNGNISFAALTVVVDDKFSYTFPYYQLPTSKASEQEIDIMKLNNAKATMLAALEFSRTAGLFKNRSMRFFEDGYFESPTN